MKELTDFEHALIKEFHSWYELADETVGSWHRFVDAIEMIANKMEDKKQ